MIFISVKSSQMFASFHERLILAQDKGQEKLVLLHGAQKSHAKPQRVQGIQGVSTLGAPREPGFNHTASPKKALATEGFSLGG
jgi:hypothetical protein